jgi:hypothetical protein
LIGLAGAVAAGLSGAVVVTGLRNPVLRRSPTLFGRMRALPVDNARAVRDARVADGAVDVALTRIGGALSVRTTVWSGAWTFAPGQRSNATTAETTANIRIDAASRTPVVPRLAM